MSEVVTDTDADMVATRAYVCGIDRRVDVEEGAFFGDEIVTHVNDQPVKNVLEFESMITDQDQLKLSIVRKLKGRVVIIEMDRTDQ